MLKKSATTIHHIIKSAKTVVKVNASMKTFNYDGVSEIKPKISTLTSGQSALFRDDVYLRKLRDQNFVDEDCKLETSNARERMQQHKAAWTYLISTTSLPTFFTRIKSYQLNQTLISFCVRSTRDYHRTDLHKTSSEKILYIFHPQSPSFTKTYCRLEDLQNQQSPINELIHNFWAHALVSGRLVGGSWRAFLTIIRR